MTIYSCLGCGAPYPDRFVHLCPDCGTIFGLEAPIEYLIENIDPAAPGIWKYRASFGLPASAPAISLGEGGTPLVPAELFGCEVLLKMESANPTGSYKDRLVAPLVSLLAAYSIPEAVEDSSGNAGAAFAAYAARAGIRAKVYVPESASGPKRAQIEAYGAEVVAVPGPRPNATEEVFRIVKKGAAYASHALLPQGLAGIATIAYELVEQLGGREPGTVIAPVGNGSLLLGIIAGFMALVEAGEIVRLPKFIGVQAEKNAPMWAKTNNQKYRPGRTIADGIAVENPTRLYELVVYSKINMLEFVTVSEAEIKKGQRELARMGFYMEPTSAVVWGALKKRQWKIEEPVVAVVSGHGLKAE